MGKKKKYDPIKEAGKITGTMVAVGVGSHVGHTVAGIAGHGMPGAITPTTNMMNILPLAQTGGSVIRSMDMFKPKKRKKRK